MANLVTPGVWHDSMETGLEVYSDSQYWYVKVKESGDVRFSYPKTVDVFVVGGGGAGGSGNGASGGGGGYTQTVRGVRIDRNTNYRVVIGAGGKASYWTDTENGAGQGGEGGETRFSLGDTVIANAAGGKGGTVLADDQGARGGAGGSGGGAGTYVDSAAAIGGAGGSDGGDGNPAQNVPQTQMSFGGAGQGSTTRAFGTGELYAGGGGGSSRESPTGAAGGDGGGGRGGSRYGSVNIDPEPGEPNTGGGGGGATWKESIGGEGGSGVVIIRGDEPDLLPVWFDGVQLSEMYLDEIPVENMVYNGRKLF